MTVLRGNLTAREPSVPRGRLGTRSRQRLRADGLLLVGAELPQLRAEVRIGDREDGDGEQGGVHGAGLSDAERSDRDAGRHLNRRKERVEAFQGNAFHRDAEHGQDRMRGEDAREMRGTAGGGDDHGETALLGARGPLGGELRAPVSRHDAALVRDAEARQQLVGVLHRLPVGGRAHDDAHERDGGAARAAGLFHGRDPTVRAQALQKRAVSAANSSKRRGGGPRRDESRSTSGGGALRPFSWKNAYMSRKSKTIHGGRNASDCFSHASRSFPPYAILRPRTPPHVAAVAVAVRTSGPTRFTVSPLAAPAAARTSGPRSFPVPPFAAPAVRAIAAASAMSRTSTRERPTSPKGCGWGTLPSMASLYQVSFWKKLFGRRIVNEIAELLSAASTASFAPKCGRWGASSARRTER